ncbi:MAG: hypothetical protein RLZ97_358 [Verrucomicrobiota bacterium]
MSPLPRYDSLMHYTRRHFMGTGGLGLGAMALAHLTGRSQAGGVLESPHHLSKVKRIIYLFQAGGPSHFETFDHKPLLRERHGQALPKEVIGNQRLSTMSGNQSILPMAGSFTGFKKYGKNGTEVSDILPYTAKIADEICVIRSMHTEAINHDPAITFFCTGSQIPGRPSMGAWASYGLGSLNDNLPAFIVLVSRNAQRDQPLYTRLWSSGFLPSEHQGVQFRSGKEPVLYLTNPEGVSPHVRRHMLDALARLNHDQAAAELDPEVTARIAQAEMAFRMQTSVPEVTDLSGESKETLELYGPDVHVPGSYAANCLLARRLVERDVRFVQLFHQGWDQHGDCPAGISRQCQQTDQASAALVIDLKRRGLLEDTLVVWGGEFGRTAYSQGKLTADNYGRDHHPRCFSIWLAGAGIKGGITHGLTDEFGYNILDGAVHVHDLHATMLHLMGVDHEKLVYKFQGRYFRLTDIAGHLVKPILA